MTVGESFPDSESLAALLRARSRKWNDGAFAAEFARVLVEEAKETSRGWQRLDLGRIAKLPLTRRIDGIMPLRVPIAADATVLADELLEECARQEIATPKDCRDALAATYLAALHRRKVRLDFGLDMELEVQCPASAFGNRRDTLLLVGKLPFGGSSTVFFSSLRCTDWSELAAADIEHAERLVAERAPSGELRIRERPADEIGNRLR